MLETEDEDEEEGDFVVGVEEGRDVLLLLLLLVTFFFFFFGLLVVFAVERPYVWREEVGVVVGADEAVASGEGVVQFGPDFFPTTFLGRVVVVVVMV